MTRRTGGKASLAAAPAGDRPDVGANVGTWDVGPFDNDDAADWCSDLDDKAPEDRAKFIRSALEDAADEEDYVDVDIAAVAIAAAAIVAAMRPGGPPVDRAYGPEFLADGATIELPADLAPLAIRALDRITGDDSEWVELWDESDSCAEAVAVLEKLRTVLA
jgi:hypothetical protein